MVELLHKVTDRHLDIGKWQLNVTESEIKEYAEKLKEYVKSTLPSVVEKIEIEIGHLKNSAENADVNIEDCLADNEDAIFELPGNYSDKATECISDLQKYFSDILQLTLGEVFVSIKIVCI